ncbi:MAG: SDR family NAD(P)-dependent oxidoreductase [Thermoplasmatales archaeon]|nr:MAG: SDR family NAD(P)-dependent oxidoreductase [Thermoplasmatales archaeon]
MEKRLKNIFKNKKILVTGGTGCIGSEIVKALLNYEPEVVRIFSNDEDSTFRMIQEIGKGDNRRFLIGDVRDIERLNLAMEEIDIVYHAAALKHVPLCEYNPFEAIKTNVLGTQNVINVALTHGTDKVINISTDKAVNPTNTMGATKLLTEKLIIDANFYKGKSKTDFSCVRFGNVSFSRGSVIPLFEEQIKRKKMITLTDKNMTRFMMSISNTIDLVFKATLMAKGGEIFVLKMPAVNLGDLADVAINFYSKKYGFEPKKIEKKIIGPRSGEKMFEELMTETEAKKAFETNDMLIIPPHVELPNVKFKLLDYHGAFHSKLKRYTSKDVKHLSKKEIEKMLFKL